MEGAMPTLQLQSDQPPIAPVASPASPAGRAPHGQGEGEGEGEGGGALVPQPPSINSPARPPTTVTDHVGHMHST